MLAMMVCIFAGCSDGGGEEPITPTPKPEEVKTEITIDSSVISNGLSFSSAEGEQSVSFSVNADWTLSIASTTSGTTWCKASATSGSKGTANVKFIVSENKDYEDRSVSVTIKAGTVSKTFTITQKGADAMLVTTTKYEVAQEGGQIEIEVKANIDYKMEISEEAKDWIKESSGRALTTYKHKLDIAMNEDAEKREGEITFKSGDKVETVKVYQAGGAILLLSQNDYNVTDKGDTISVDIKSNIDFGVQMPDVDWIVDEASSRGLSSHTLKYIVSANEGYDSRSAEIIFYDKNSDLKDTLKVSQAQKNAIILSEKEIVVSSEGETIEVKLSANVDFEVVMPEVDWINQVSSRALKEHILYFKVSENTGDKERKVEITFTNKESQLEDGIIINQKCPRQAGYEDGIVTIATAGTMRSILGDGYLNITSLKVVGPINGDDIFYLRKMLGDSELNQIDRGKLTTLDLSEASIVEGGDWYYEYSSSMQYCTTNDEIGDYMFHKCANLQNIVLPKNITSIGTKAFYGCSSLISFTIPDSVTKIATSAFAACTSLTSIYIPESVTSIGETAFYKCSTMSSIVIPNSVTSIGRAAFQDCSSLISIDIPDSVKKMEHETFFRCTSLTSVTIGDGLTSIPSEAFLECSSLTSVKIGDGVTSIGHYAFELCSSLTSLSLGKKVSSIGYLAFYKCDSLKECYCYATRPPSINAGDYPSFPKYGNQTILYVPLRYGAKYNTSRWGTYFKNIKEMEK